MENKIAAHRIRLQFMGVCVCVFLLMVPLLLCFFSLLLFVHVKRIFRPAVLHCWFDHCCCTQHVRRRQRRLFYPSYVIWYALSCVESEPCALFATCCMHLCVCANPFSNNIGSTRLPFVSIRIHHFKIAKKMYRREWVLNAQHTSSSTDQEWEKKNQ